MTGTPGGSIHTIQKLIGTLGGSIVQQLTRLVKPPIFTCGIDQQVKPLSVSQLIGLLGRFCVAYSGISKGHDGISGDGR